MSTRGSGAVVGREARTVPVAVLLAVAVLTAVAVAACGSQAKRGGSRAARANLNGPVASCAKPSPIDQAPGIGGPEVVGHGTDARLWGLIQAGESPLVAGRGIVKIVWHMTGSGPLRLAADDGGGREVRIAWGPEGHGGSNYNRPGDECGAGYRVRKPGCYRLTARRAVGSAYVWLRIASRSHCSHQASAGGRARRDPGSPVRHPIRGMPSAGAASRVIPVGVEFTGTRQASRPERAVTTRSLLAPLALTQFIASFAGSNMNVAISSIGKDIGTTVHGVQTAITLFLLCMAALMIPGSKLTDILGRKRCLVAGLTVYGIGALVASLAQGLPLLIVGYSGLEGVGSALMIPPIYILATMFFSDTKSRAKAFGVISGMGGIGAAAGPLIGGLITTTISWRASFLLQAVVVALIVVLVRRVVDPLPADPRRRFDTGGAVLSAAGMLFIVLGILQAGSSWPLLALLLAIGAGLQVWFYLHVRAVERTGQEPLLSTSLFHNRTSNLAMLTQNIQWLLLMGSTFVVTVFLQVVHGYSAIQTGVIFTAATAGILVSSLAAQRLAERHAQRTLILVGFVVTVVGIAMLIGLYRAAETVWVLAPGLLVMGLGLGAMLTPSVNVVQSAFPEEKQGEISGLSRAVSNLGSSLGTAIAGTIVVANAAAGNTSYVVAMVVLAAIALCGLAVAYLIPSGAVAASAPAPNTG